MEDLSFAMTKTNEAFTDLLRDPKHPFRASSDRPKKSLKHRYERRKARECLKRVVWDDDEG